MAYGKMMFYLKFMALFSVLAVIIIAGLSWTLTDNLINKKNIKQSLSYFTNFGILTLIFLALFYLLIFIIAGLGVANTMIMTVTRRTREIGILMAMGADAHSIKKIFILESVILGPPSALLGGGLAYVASKLIGTIEVPAEIYIADRMTVVLDPGTFFAVALAALLINLLAGIYPAYKAARLDPVKAIATE